MGDLFPQLPRRAFIRQLLHKATDFAAEAEGAWRAGYCLVDFVHDQGVVETPADDRVDERVAHIESLMKQGMLMVAPGMLVKLETVVTRSLNKSDLDPRYVLGKKEKSPENAVVSS